LSDSAAKPISRNSLRVFRNRDFSIFWTAALVSNLARTGGLYGLLSRFMRRAAGGLVVRPLQPESNFTVVTKRDDGSGV